MPIETISVPLSNEGTDVWRPVAAERLGDGVFRILGTMPDDEDWAFKPGEMVMVRHHVFSGSVRGLIAVDELSTFHHTGLEANDKTSIELADTELRIICAALNEVCNGIDLQNEFVTRIGCSVEIARNLLARLAADVPSVRPAIRT